MELRVVFTRKDDSFISRAIIWFTQRKNEPARRCSHVMFKFAPGGVFGDMWVAFEAMERGCWMSPYNVSLGKQTVVAEFSVVMDPETVPAAVSTMMERYLSWYYDYTGIGLWALWIMAKRWFATPLRWFNVIFRPKKASKALFCSGLIRNGLVICEVVDPLFKSHMADMSARETTPQNEIDICFQRPDHYKYIGGVPTS